MSNVEVEGAGRGPLQTSGGDSGMALLTVVVTMLIVSLTLITGLTVVLSNTASVRRSQDARTAYAAARAGIEEYLGRLNATSGNYWIKGNSDPANPALTPSGPGMAIPGTNSAGGRFRYQVLNPTKVLSTGRIELQVTGISSPGGSAQLGQNTVTKTLTASLRPNSFGNYIWITDLEDLDPALMASSTVPVVVNGASGPGGSASLYYAGNADSLCALHTYEGRGDSVSTSHTGGFTIGLGTPQIGVWNSATNSWAQPPGSVSGHVSDGFCATVVWAGHRMMGNVHSNDGLYLYNDTEFGQDVTSSWPACESNPTMNCWLGPASPIGVHRPVYGPRIQFPKVNSSLTAIAKDPTLGCYYTGATEVVFTGTTMSVYSPNTTSSSPTCFDAAAAGSWQVYPIPSVIYVDQVQGTCQRTHYPLSGQSETARGLDYSCNRGTVFVKGTVSGQVSIASADDIAVVGDLTYADNLNGTDVIGLMAEGAVMVYHPMDASGQNLAGYSLPHNIQALILALTHSFSVENFAMGQPITTSGSTRLLITGGTYQKFRGATGTVSGPNVISGYTADYQVDPRLVILQPPFFLQPVGSPWKATNITDG